MPRKKKAEQDNSGQSEAGHESDRTIAPFILGPEPRLPFPVVGIGASAGGLEAFTAFFQSMPADSGMAFVLILHLPPERESLLAEILARHTRMPVMQVENRMEIQANHVYVIRPAHTMIIRDGRLHLTAPLEKVGHRRPVDDFFRSLAEEQRERAICIVMSGMGTNGSAGAHEVKAAGGICIAQDPDTAQFSSMPRSLIDMGLADRVLTPQQMPDVLLNYSRHPYLERKPDPNEILKSNRASFQEILAILRTRHNHDFSSYKKPTLIRRIQRRMGLLHVQQLGEYADYLRAKPEETMALVDDLLINVTGFFRDPAAWHELAEKAISPMLSACDDRSPIRAWVAACSSGEEAYTLAMVLIEQAEALKKQFDIKVFATDTAQRALNHARAGLYPAGIESDVSPERLERFFDKEEHAYRIKKELRELVVFAPQNILQDPPFSRLDIICCRNLLIYLEPDVQRKMMTLFHFALRAGGSLFLGTAETIGLAEDLFEPVSKKWRIFRRLGQARRGTLDFPLVSERHDRAQRRELALQSVNRLSIAQLAQGGLVERYGPPSVVIDRKMRVVYFHGQTHRFLNMPPGEPTSDLLAMARETVRSAVRNAVRRAFAENHPVTVQDASTETEQGVRQVSVTVVPLERQAHAEHFLVSFEERAGPPSAAPSPIGSAPESQAARRQLEQELRIAREELQGTIEDLESSNEEMKASNEETVSVNEELQSTNEELETSKEELQSLNEELSTVNSQLQAKVEELEGATNDLSNLLANTQIPTLFLDTRFNIRRYTPAMNDLIELLPSDLGRPLQHFARKFSDEGLLRDAKSVLEKLVPIQAEISSNSGQWYIRRILPYRTADNRIDGVVITFIEITEHKQSEDDLRMAKERAENASKVKDEFLATISHELRTPLAVILLWAKMLRSGNPKTDMDAALAAIIQSAQAQQRLVEDLLDISRTVSGKLQLKLGVVELAPIVQEAIDTIHLGAQSKGIAMEARLEPTRSLVHVDPGRIRQVVWNLLSNAVKFTPSGGRVQVLLNVAGDRARITVSDNGQGISPTLLSKVFNRFQQGEADATTRTHGGLGLGLAIVRELVELHGGTVHAESAGEGHGASFIVELPLTNVRSAPQVEEDSTNRDNEDFADNGQRLAGMSVLLVEDEPSVLQILARTLEQAGATVTSVESVASALDRLRKSHHDVLVSDIALPDHDGYELIREIRREEAESGRKRLPAMALTAYAQIQDRDKAIAAGFDDYLVKPVEPGQLIGQIAQLKNTV